MIKLEDLTLPSADMGPDNPMPDIFTNTYIHAVINVGKNLNEEERKNVGKGMIHTTLPYKMQDGYNRVKKDRVFKTVVLENDFIKATFAPELGARLLSIYDKKTKRDLLYNNPVFQPGNLAIRNAWISGGVEFNVGIKGHTPLTCSKMFAAKIKTDCGQIVTFYEYERIREVCYSISAYLPDDEAVLYIRPRIENTKDEEVPMYWWSNTAVDSTPKTRVIVPTEEAYVCTYHDDSYVLDREKVCHEAPNDVSYSGAIKTAFDYFYKIPKEDPKWIASVDEGGYGLLHCSTNKLIGKKLFVWGQSDGGKNWSDFLSVPDKPYIEIQAGLAYTQMEHIPMPGNAMWEWVETYSAVNCSPEKVHSTNYSDAVSEVISKIPSSIGVKSTEINDALLSRFPKEEGTHEIIFYGSGWGNLTNRIREIEGKNPISEYYEFPYVEDESSMWHRLIDRGTLPKEDEPTSYVKDPVLIKRMEYAEKNWHIWMQLGVSYYANGEFEKAENAFNESNKCKENGWAYHNLALMYAREYHDMKKALTLMDKANSVMKNHIPLLKNYEKLLLEAKEYEKLIEVVNSSDKSVKKSARVQLYLAMAYVYTDRLDEAAAIINKDYVLEDIKEGELSVTAVWDALYEKIVARDFGLAPDEAKTKAREIYPLPKPLNFRMSIE